MELPSTYLYQGWSIRFNIFESDTDPTSDRVQERRCVVFVHGTPWSSAVFEPITKALLAKGSYRVLIYDLPGYGKSQDFENSSQATVMTESRKWCFRGDTSVNIQAQALKALLGHVHMDGKQGHPIPAVIAHDIAGAIVLRAHLLLGCEFESMMLCDTNAVLPWGDGFYKLARSEPKVFMDLPPNIFEAVVRAVIKSARHKPDVSHSEWENELAQPWIPHSSDSVEADSRKRQESFVRQIAQTNDQDVAEMLQAETYSRVLCDVMILWGEQDQWIPREKMEELRERIGDKVREYAVIPEAGHLIMLDQPERFAIEVLTWLNRPGSLSTSIRSLRA